MKLPRIVCVVAALAFVTNSDASAQNVTIDIPNLVFPPDQIVDGPCLFLFCPRDKREARLVPTRTLGEPS